MFDHGFLYGVGVFDGIRAYCGKVFKLDEHIDRLFDGASYLSLSIPMTKEDVKSAVREGLRVNEMSDAYIRLVVTRGVGTLGLDPDKCDHPSVIIITDRVALYPEDLYERGLEIITATTRRNISEALNVRVKSLNYLNNILAKIEGKHAGVPAVLMLNHDGLVT